MVQTRGRNLDFQPICLESPKRNRTKAVKIMSNISVTLDHETAEEEDVDGGDIEEMENADNNGINAPESDMQQIDTQQTHKLENPKPEKVLARKKQRKSTKLHDAKLATYESLEDDINEDFDATFTMEMISETLDQLRLTRPTPPPLIPLCRILKNEAVRTVTSSTQQMREVFRSDGYVQEKGSFILSMQTLRKDDVWVDDTIKAGWDPIWRQINEEFELEVATSEDWKDLSGRMFLCWEGNHRTVAWMEEIASNYTFSRGRHVRVLASFVVVDRIQEGPLISSLNRINELNEVGVVKNTLKDTLYSVYKVATSNPEKYTSRLEPSYLKSLKLKDSSGIAGDQWYPLPRLAYCKILFQRALDRDIEQEIKKIGQTDDVETMRSNARRKVHEKWITKMGKYLGIVNPSLGSSWLHAVTHSDLETKSMNITVEKLIEMVKAKVPNHIRDKWIHWMSSGVAITSTYGIPTNDKDFRDWVKKEVWLEHLLSRAKEIFLRTSEDFNIVTEIHRGDDLESWFRQFKLENRKMMFKNYEKEMLVGSTVNDAIEIEKSATRVCHRYYKYLVKQNLLHQIPIQIKVWCKKDEHGMYSEKGNMDRPGGLSDYEVIHCPWWLDFPINSYPAEEKDEWHNYQKDILKASTPIPSSKRLDVQDSKHAEKKKRKVKHKIVGVSDEESIDVGHVEHTCPQPFEIICNVAIEIHCADICQISGDLNRKIENNSFKQLRDFARSHAKPLATYMRAGKERDWGFDVLLMDFPTNDFPIADCSEIPDWNKCPQTLIEAAFALGNLCLDDGGWIVAICSLEQCKQVEKAGKLRKIEIMRTYTVVSDKPFGFKIDKLGTLAQLSLQVYVMGRIGTTPHIQASSSIDYPKSIIHHRHLQAAKCLASPERQSTEKSIRFMEYLLEMLCPEGGVVLDLFAGTGSMLMACAIRGCHCFSFDSDPVLCDLVKAKRISKLMKPNALTSGSKNENYDSESEDEDVVGQDVEEPEEYALPDYAEKIAIVQASEHSPVTTVSKRKRCLFVDDECIESLR